MKKNQNKTTTITARGEMFCTFAGMTSLTQKSIFFNFITS